MSALPLQAIVLAFIGGIAFDFLALVELQKTPTAQRPDLSDPLYWFILAFWPFMSGFLGYLFDEDSAHLSKIVSFQIGIAAPLILRTLANAIPGQVTKSLPPGA